MTITIPWEDGSEDNFYIDYTNPLNPVITSDENLDHITRRKVIRYTTNQSTPNGTVYLIVEQRFDGLIIPIFETTVPSIDNTISGF